MDAVKLSGLIEDHAQFPVVLAALLPVGDHARMREREADRRWSPLEILVHLRDEELEDFGARAKLAAAGKLIESGIDPEGWVVARAYNEQDPVAVLAGFESERARSVEWLRSLSLEDLECGVEHPQHGRFRCGDFVAAWRQHDLLHLRQLATTLARQHARAHSSWRVSYAGRLP